MNPLDKQEKKAKASLDRLIQHIRNEWSMKRIKTLHDYFHSLGYDDTYIKGILNYYDSELSQPITFPEVKSRLSDLQIALSTEWYLIRNPPFIERDNSLVVRTSEMEVVSSLEVDSTKKAKVLHEDTQNGTYGLWPSEKEKAKLYWFQRKYAKALLDGLEITAPQ